MSRTQAFSGAASGVRNVSLPDRQASWLPAELVQLLSQVAASLAPLVDSLLQAAPAVAGGLTWVVWAIGGGLLQLLHAGLHMLIAMWRRRANGNLGPGAGPSLAAG